MSWTNTWDLTTPLPDDPAKQGDDEIRLMKAVIQERFATLTNFPNSAGSALSLLANAVGTAQIVDHSVTLVKLDVGVIPALQVAIIAGDTWIAGNATYDGANWQRTDVSKFATAIDLSGVGTATTDLLFKWRYAVAAANPIGAWVDLLKLYGDGKLETTGRLLVDSDRIELLPSGTDSLELQHVANVRGLTYNLTAALAQLDAAKNSFGLYCPDTTKASLYVASPGVAASTLYHFSAAGLLDIHNSGGQLQINGTKVIGSRITGWAAQSGTLFRGNAGIAANVLDLDTIVAALISDLMTQGIIGA